MLIIVWILTGLGFGVLARAVSPAWQAPGALLAGALGVVGGAGGGLLIDALARRTVAGFTAGEIGAIMGASVLLIIGAVIVEPSERPA